MFEVLNLRAGDLLLRPWSMSDLPALAAFVEPWNEASLTTARRCGFTEWGKVRAHHKVDTEPRDAIRMTRSGTAG